MDRSLRLQLGDEVVPFAGGVRRLDLELLRSGAGFVDHRLEPRDGGVPFRQRRLEPGGGLVRRRGPGLGGREVSLEHGPRGVGLLAVGRQGIEACDQLCGRLVAPCRERRDRLLTAGDVPLQVGRVGEGLGVSGLRGLEGSGSRREFGREEIGSAEIEAIVSKAIDGVCAGMEDPLPESYRRERDLMPLAAAWKAMHAPQDRDQLARARRRLAFDEFLLLQLGVMMRRAQLRARTRAVALPLDASIDAHIRSRIPFTLTGEQDRVVGELAHDLAEPAAMNRLLQGDVGSGKTAVAAYCMLLAVAHKHQAALVAPTEILAEQHHRVLSRMLEGSDVQLRLLTGSSSDAERNTIVAGLARGSVNLVVGTHALLEGGVAFRSLAVAVIDEQHRFGVKQRAAMRQKGQGEMPLVPHTLVMTATPIPRTLAITLYGDLDLSTLRGKPPGRQPAITRVVDMAKAPEVYAYLRKRIDAGEQAYVVVPAVEESEQGLKDIASHSRYLAEGPFRGLAIANVHGRLDRDEREAEMQRFRSGDAKVLVATTVIEVGIDIPNASLMVVEHAERFGLAQLHQLRGRVGRGTGKSLCVFIGDAGTPDAAERLAAIGASDDGFEVAESDLRLRGPGEVFGARQSGLAPFRVADLSTDADLLRLARADAQAWIGRDPDLMAPESALLRRKLLHTHGAALGLGDVG